MGLWQWLIEKDEESLEIFTWRIQLSSSLFTLSPFLVHHLVNRGWQSMTVCVLEALRVCGLGVLVPSFDGFSSRRPLLVSHLLVRGICLPSLYALSFPLYGSFSSRAIGFKSVHKMALHVIIPVKGFCYGSTTPRPYPARSLPARLWHRCTDEVFVWAPTQPICDKDLTELRFKLGSPSWDTGALTTTPRAHAPLDCLFHLKTTASITKQPSLIVKKSENYLLSK